MLGCWQILGSRKGIGLRLERWLRLYWLGRVNLGLLQDCILLILLLLLVTAIGFGAKNTSTNTSSSSGEWCSSSKLILVGWRIWSRGEWLLVDCGGFDIVHAVGILAAIVVAWPPNMALRAWDTTGGTDEMCIAVVI